MCDSRIYSRYRCADPVTGLCVCDPSGPYSSKQGCENSWQCHLDNFDTVHDYNKMQPHQFSDHRSFPASGAQQVTGKLPQGSISRATEPRFYWQQ